MSSKTAGILKQHPARTKKMPKEEFLVYQNGSLAEEVALYYGFRPFPCPSIKKDDSEKAKVCDLGTETKRRNSPRVSSEEKIAVIRSYEEQGLYKEPQPVMLFIDWSANGIDDAKHKPVAKNPVCHYSLEVVGTGKAVAEATLIKTAFEILREEGFENLYIEVNSLGDKESIQRFVREITNYYRKNLSALPAEYRQVFKRDPCALLCTDNEKCRELAENAPKAVDCLSELSRAYLSEILEFLESMNIPYRINDTLVAGRTFINHTIFRICTLGEEHEEEKVLALGFRYNSLAKLAGWKREILAAGVDLLYSKPSHGTEHRRIRIRKPQIYFIQLGFEAKLLSLKVIELLRQAKVPMRQSLSRDKLTAQISEAEAEKIPYAIIIGQKEAVEKSVIVRNMTDRSQETVPITELPEYLKKMKIAG